MGEGDREGREGRRGKGEGHREAERVGKGRERETGRQRG